MKRYLLVSDEYGVFIAEGFGVAFWSKPHSDQDHAWTFPTPTDIAECLATWHPQPDFNWRAIEVKVSSAKAPYATKGECVAAGVERWEPWKP